VTELRAQVETYAKAVDTLTQRGRTGEAQQYRNYVLNVAMTFNVPAPQMSGASVPGQLNTSVPATDVATLGKKLCTDIDQCMREGQLVQARKLANTLYEGPYGSEMKTKAGQYLAQIDAAEEARGILRDVLREYLPRGPPDIQHDRLHHPERAEQPPLGEPSDDALIPLVPAFWRVGCGVDHVNTSNVR
jgi:hypothetical protein